MFIFMLSIATVWVGFDELNFRTLNLNKSFIFHVQEIASHDDVVQYARIKWQAQNLVDDVETKVELILQLAYNWCDEK